MGLNYLNKIEKRIIKQMAAIPASWLSRLVVVAFGALQLGLFPIQAAHLSSGSGEDIQRALDSLPANEAVTLGPGTFLVRTPVILSRNGQILRGSGTNTVLRLADNANCPVIVLGAPLEATNRTTRDLEVSHLAIDGNRAHQQVELWRSAVDGCLLNNNGINVWNVTDVKISRVTAFRCRSGGIVTAAGVRRLSVEHFEAYDHEFDGLACYQTEESRFTDLYLHDNRAAGISLDQAFNNNVIERAVLARNDLGVFMRESSRNVFRELTIEDTRNHGVFVAQRAELTPKGWLYVADTECKDNVFESMAVNKCGGKPHVVNDLSCTNNRFPQGPLPQSFAKKVIVAEVDPAKLSRDSGD
jgi:hypothetical protein